MNAQRIRSIVRYVGYIVVGFLAFGAILDAVSGARSLITLPVAILLTAFLLPLLLFDRQILKRFVLQWDAADGASIRVERIEQIDPTIKWKLIGTIILTWSAVGLSLWSAQSAISTEVMTGDFRIAVSEFEVDDQDSQYGRLGIELADSVRLRLQRDFDELPMGFSVTVWGPPQVASVQGKTPAARAKSAARIANELRADVVVYGQVESDGATWRVSPEFYVSGEQSFDAIEITGSHVLGSAFLVPRHAEIVGRLRTGEEFSTRVRPLSLVIVGLAYYSVGEFESALQAFSEVVSAVDWKDSQGKWVVYLLSGNSAGKLGDLAAAREYYERSLSIQPDYARAYLGLGSVYYLSALTPFAESGNPQMVDDGYIESALDAYQNALQAEYHPPGANVPLRAHYGLGQTLLLTALATGDQLALNEAEIEFETAIRLNDSREANPAVLEVVAEAHARLGLIHDLRGNPRAAAAEYAKAVSLIGDRPERRALFEQRTAQLRNLAQTK